MPQAKLPQEPSSTGHPVIARRHNHCRCQTIEGIGALAVAQHAKHGKQNVHDHDQADLLALGGPNQLVDTGGESTGGLQEAQHAGADEQVAHDGDTAHNSVIEGLEVVGEGQILFLYPIKHIRVDDLAAGVFIQYTFKVSAGDKERDYKNKEHDDGQDDKDVGHCEFKFFPVILI